MGALEAAGPEVRTRALSREGLLELLGLLFPRLEGADELAGRLHAELGGRFGQHRHQNRPHNQRRKRKKSLPAPTVRFLTTSSCTETGTNTCTAT